jgi:hypothetical protein
MPDRDAPETGADDTPAGVVDPTDALLREPVDADDHAEEPGHPATASHTVSAGEQLSGEGGTAGGARPVSGPPPEQR